jgi:hypothetical protein
MKKGSQYGLYIAIGLASLITLELAYNYYKNTTKNRQASLTESTDSLIEEEKKSNYINTSKQ